MSFRDWIKRHEGRDTPMGDLARDVCLDRAFPEDDDFDTIYGHLERVARRQIRHRVLRTFREAWAAYAKQGNAKLPSEAEIEHWFCKQVDRLGGTAIKFTPNGWSGAPDRLVLLPGGIVKFVEFKVLAAEPRPLQKLRLVQLHGLGFEAYVIDSKRDVEAFIDLVKSEIPDEPAQERFDYDSIEGLFRL